MTNHASKYQEPIPATSVGVGEAALRDKSFAQHAARGYLLGKPIRRDSPTAYQGAADASYFLGFALGRLAFALGFTCGLGGVASIRRSTSSKDGAGRSLLMGVAHV